MFGILKRALQRFDTESFVLYLISCRTSVFLVICSLYLFIAHFVEEITCPCLPLTGTDYFAIYHEVLTYSCGSEDADADCVDQEFQGQFGHQKDLKNLPSTFLLLALLFLIPHFCSRWIEPTFMSNISDVFRKATKNAVSHHAGLISMFSEVIYDKWGSHGVLALKYASCEILALAVVVGGICMLDESFHGRFLNMGFLLDPYSTSKLLSESDQVPSVPSICTLESNSNSNRIGVVDAMCVMRIINQNVYRCIWIWFAILFFLSFFHTTYLVACIAFEKCRFFVPAVKSFIHRKNQKQFFFYEYWKVLVCAGDSSDWFVLKSFENVIDKCIFYNIMSQLIFDEPHNAHLIEESD